MTSGLFFPRAALLGVGYIGGSLALALRRAGVVETVVGFDMDRQAAETGRARGAIDGIASSPEEAAKDASLVLLAAPVASLLDLGRQIRTVLSDSALVVDVGSVKTSVVRELDMLLPPGTFVGCHPLAGTERSGPAAADVELFATKLCFICPGTRASASGVVAAISLWEAVGAKTVRMDPAEHDALMAAVSHLPHVAAFALAAALAEMAPQLQSVPTAAVATTSLRDTTRVAASSPVVWRDIFLENRAHLLPLARALGERVGRLADAMESGDAAALEELLCVARASRDRLVPGGA